MSLQHKVAVVTGAWGIRSMGRAIALRLAREGADVVVSDIPPPDDRVNPAEKAANWRGIESVAGEISELGRRSIAINCDLTREDEIKALVDQTVESMGSIDIVINCARAFMSGQPKLLDITESQWDFLMSVNLRGPLTTSKHAARAMIKAGKGGSIVNISSIGGKKALPDAWAPYAVSKAALNMLTQTMALEVAPNIRVNAICPGFIHTSRVMPEEVKRAESAGKSFDVYRAEVLEERAHTIPLGRPGTPEDIAEVACFLASPMSAYMTGQVLCVDGGVVMD